MTQETEQLSNKINDVRHHVNMQENPSVSSAGYGVAVNILTDLFGCVFIGLAIGVLCQKLFHTSGFVVAIMTLLGGFAGLWTVIRYGISLDYHKEQ